MVASISLAKRATRSAADCRRANRTPCPDQSDKNSARPCFAAAVRRGRVSEFCSGKRSEEHTSELQSLRHLVCRLLLEKKNHNRRHLHLQTFSDSAAIPGRSRTRS